MLFLGGWNGPIPVAELLGLATSKYAILVWLANLLGCANLLVKVYLAVIFMMWLRWTLPRLRIDQVMATCLKYCVPLASIMLVGAAVWTFCFPGGLVSKVFGSKAAVKVHAAAVGWVDAASPTKIREKPLVGARPCRSAHPTFLVNPEESLMLSTIHWHSVFFLFSALAACGAALAVVFSSNIVRMAFYLILSLGATAGLFFLAGAEFLGAVQLMVYVGGTLVLLVFGVMLTARGPFVSLRTGGGQWILALLAGGALLVVILQAALGVGAWAGRAGEGVAPQAAQSQSATPLGMALLGVRTDRLDSAAAARPDVAGYLLVFEIISIHLLVVLVGAAYLARAKRRVGSSELEEERS